MRLIWLRETRLRHSAAEQRIGVLGGLIGLGGAEFRLPLLIGAFRFAALEGGHPEQGHEPGRRRLGAAVSRAGTVPFAAVAATTGRSSSICWRAVCSGRGSERAGRSGFGHKPLHRVIAIMLGLIAVVLLSGHGVTGSGAMLTGVAQAVAGVVAGFCIGIVAALLGVAGGELLIPTLVLLFGADIKLAGSLSLAVSLPTIIVGFTRYSRDQSFSVLGRNRAFVLVMAAGSVVGTFIGGRLLGLVPTPVLLPLLTAILVISAVKVWRT